MFIELQKYSNNDTKDSWSKWDSYRRTWGIVLKQTLERYNIALNKVLLIGPGNGNDIDIEYLESTFNEIILIDIDGEALERFLSKVTKKHKFSKKIIDISGINHLVKNLNIHNMEDDHLIKLIDQLQPSIKLDNLKTKYDLIIHCSYSTQLVSPFFTQKFIFKRQPAPSAIQKSITDLESRIHLLIFGQIHDLLHDNGLTIRFTDTFEMKYDLKNHSINPAGKRILEIMNNDWKNIDNILKPEHFKDLINQGYSISGSLLPAEVYKNNQFIHETTFILLWPFIDNKIEIRNYIVLASVMKKLVRNNK